VIDLLEKLYLGGFIVLLAFVTLTSKMDFLPLMATSIYCSIGTIWSFLRLGFIYLFEESSYQGQLSTVTT
jgi:alpha-1,3-glucosyltransferase